MRQMNLLENVEGRCDNCILNRGCSVLELLDLTTSDLDYYENHEKLLCPVGINVKNGFIV